MSKHLEDCAVAVWEAECARDRAVYGIHYEFAFQKPLMRYIWGYEALMEARGEWLRALVFFLLWVREKQVHEFSFHQESTITSDAPVYNCKIHLKV